MEGMPTMTQPRVLTPEEANELIADLIEKKPTEPWQPSEMWAIRHCMGTCIYRPRENYCRDLRATWKVKAHIMTGQNYEWKRRFIPVICGEVTTGEAADLHSDGLIMALIHEKDAARELARVCIYALTGEVVQIERKDGE
jgi:hypothetical protein